MHTVQQILNLKAVNEIWSVEPDTTVYEAIQSMADKRAGALLVMQNDRLEGIISERDYAREVILKGRASRDTAVREVMSSQVITVAPTESVEFSLGVMTNNHIRHLPVVETGKVIGVVSIGDLVRDVINDQ